MPNCDFYAVRDDQIGILQFIFQETDCIVYEDYSKMNEELRTFDSIEKLDAWHEIGTHFRLMLYSPAMRGDVRIVRSEWEAKRSRPAGHRSQITGWGLIDLDLECVTDGGIRHSHTNHNTEKRVLVREDLYMDRLGPASAWDWKAITAISSKINRYIRKMSPAKFGPLPIMPAAQQMVTDGKAELRPR